jgi:hypothetical protein
VLHQVQVTEQGFDYRGKRFTSLTARNSGLTSDT